MVNGDRGRNRRKGVRPFCYKSLEAAVGLEPTKTGFADQRLDRFGIAASEKLYPESIPKTVPKMPPQLLFAPIQVLVTY